MEPREKEYAVYIKIREQWIFIGEIHAPDLDTALERAKAMIPIMVEPL